MPKVAVYKYLGVMFGAEGLDVENTARLRAEKVTAQTHWLAEKGMNPKGFSFRTCQQLIHSCIRPSLEYGMAVATYSEEQLKGLESALVYACCRAMGVYKNTSRSRLLKLFQQVPMQQRQKELSAMWVEKTESN